MDGFYLSGNGSAHAKKNHPSEADITPLKNPATELSASANKQIIFSGAIENSVPEKVLPVERTRVHSVFPGKFHFKKKRIVAEVPADGSERKNHVPKAGFRLAIYAIIFFCGAMYAFFQAGISFYFVLGILFIAFLLALVALITSISGGRDKSATTKGGRWMAFFGALFSLSVFAAIAWFFINNKIEID